MEPRSDTTHRFKMEGNILTKYTELGLTLLWAIEQVVRKNLMNFYSNRRDMETGGRENTISLHNNRKPYSHGPTG